MHPLIPDGDCHVLVTTRDRAWLEHASGPECQLEVLQMTPAAALQLLGANDKGARDLAAHLAYLPLALSHARKLKLKGDQSYAEVLVAARKVEGAVASGDAALPEHALLRGYPKAVLAIFDTSLQAIQAELAASPREAPARLVQACGYLDPERMPEPLLRAFLARACGVEDEDAAGDVLSAMVRFGMLARREDGSLDMHRVLQAAMRAKDGDKAVLRATVELLDSVFKFDHARPTHPEMRALAPHVDAVVQAALRAPSLFKLVELAKCQNMLGRWCKFSGLYQKVAWWGAARRCV